MITFGVSSHSPAQAEADVLLLPCFKGPVPGPGLAEVAHGLGVDVIDRCRRRGFTGNLGDIWEIDTLARLPVQSVILAGLGEEGQAGVNAIRQSAMVAARRLRGHVSTTLPAALPLTHERRDYQDTAAAFTEGVLLGAYRFDRYKHPAPVTASDEPPLERVTILASEAHHATITSGVSHGEVYARVANWARDLVNTPAGDAKPSDLADEATHMAAEHDISCKVWARAELERHGFGGILGVGQGSANEPRLVEMSYRGGSSAPSIGLTGKGVTFDSGGLSLKRLPEMEWMKSDMAGAAAIMAAMRGAAELGLRVNLHAVLPFAENLPGGSALRPGDVVRHRGGKTSEVADTDNEGRLVVADALAYLAEHGPAAILDVATLTDAAGLGEALWAAMGNDRELVADVLAAGEVAGDPGWQLPLPAEYRRHVESAVADVRNSPEEAPDTTITAAMYLREFVGDTPWVHIDNGSSAYLERATDRWPKGATGSPARAVLRLIEDRALRAGHAAAASRHAPTDPAQGGLEEQIRGRIRQPGRYRSGRAGAGR